MVLLIILTLKKLIQTWVVDFVRVIIEGDNVSIIRWIQQTMSTSSWKTDPYLRPSLAFLLSFKQVIFMFVPKTCNRAVNFYAKKALIDSFI